jgi:protein TIF31
MAALERSRLNSQSNDPLQAVCDATFQGVEAAKKGNISLIDSVTLCPSWLVPEQSKNDTDSIFEYNLGKSELSCIEDSFGLDVRGGAPRDWNEELQGAREMARDTLDQRIERARLIYRTFVDFGHAAFAGVMAICNGQIRALNPNEPPRNHVYLFNNIFFSRAADAGMDTFKVYSGDQAARKAASRDARCVGILNRMDIEGLNTLATTLIDYLGSRFVCQSVVPGILLGDKTHKVLYGSVESSNPLSWDQDFHHKLESNLGDVLMIATRKMKKQPLDQGETVLSETDSSADENVTSSSDELIDVFGSIEMKGIQGSDKRTYCLDISRLTPRDANWVCKDKGGTGKFESVAPEKPLDIPVSLDDDEWIMAVLRPELITRYVQKKGKEHVASIRAKEEESKSGDEKISSNGSASENEKELSEEEKEKMESERNAKAEEHEKIYLNYIKQFKMNLNVFLPRVKAIDESDTNAKTQLEYDIKRITDISNYLWDEVLPVITHEVKENADSIPVDGKGLSEFLHRNGVNCRYLGRLATLAIEEEQKDLKDSEQYILDLKAGKKTTYSRYSMSPCWLELLETEMVARAAKHVLDRYWIENLGIARSQPSKMVAAFLSALVSESEESAAETDRRINSKTLRESTNDDLAYRWPVQNEVEIRGRGEVWSDISKEVGKRFRYSLHLYNTHGKHSSRTPYGALLRRVCERIGVRLYAKAYSLGGKCLCSTENSFPISAPDIAGILPMMKHAATEDSSSFLPCNHGADAANTLLHVSLADAKLLLNNARAFQRAQSLQMALELSQEASQLYQRVTDTPLHSKISECANLIANILFQAQETDLACVHATKATALTIQTGGFDTVDVISAVMTLSHTLLNSGQVPEAIKQMRSLIYLVEMISGPNHAVLSSLYSRLGAVYLQLGVPQLALSFMQVSAIYKATNDKISQAQSYRQIAELSMKCGMHKQAIEAAKVAHNLFFMVLGPDHDVTKTLGVELQFYVKEGAKEETKEQAEMEMKIQIEKANKVADEIIAQVENEEKSKTKKKKKKKKKN